MKKHLLPLLIVAALLVAACTVQAPPAPAAPTATTAPAPAVEPTPEPAAEPAAAGNSTLTADALMNAAYSGIYDQPITLVDGLYEGEPFAANDPARPTVQYVEGAELFGDLDGDGVDDAVVFLIERGGGSGAFTYVAAQLNRSGQPADAGAVRIEDRIGVKSAAVQDGQIVLEIVTQGPGDAACCSTHKAARTYAVQDGRLVETTAPGGDLVRISAADLDGTRWTLLELGEDQPALADAAVTLSFQDGQVSGSGGCNTISGSFTLGEDNPLLMAVGPLAATEMSCSDPVNAQESAYLAALAQVSRWGYEYGNLALYYADGENGESRLLFAPVGAAAAAGQEPGGAGIVLDADTERMTPPPALSTRERGIVEVPCELGMPTGPGEVEGETYTCGIFTVPLFWDKPDSPNIDLHFIVTKATGDDPQPDPLVYLAGGPGQSAVVSKIAAHDQVRATRDIVRMDQRGAGLSQRLGLEECLVLAAKDQAARDQLALLVEFLQRQGEDTPSAPASASDMNFDLKVHELCSKEFAAQGLDLDAFTTQESARDVLALMQALGYDAFNLHGVSYGTRLAMSIMALLPQIEDAPALRSVVLDSTLPPSVYLLSSFPRYPHDPVVQLLDECQQDESCRTAFPNLAQRLAALLAQLAAEPLTVGEETIAVEDVAAVLTDLTGSKAAFMPLMIAELERGVTDTYQALRDGELGTESPESGPSLDMSDPVQAFQANAMKALGAGGDLGAVLEFLGAYTEILAKPEPYAAVEAFLPEKYQGDTLAALQELFAAVTPEDFEQSSYVAQLRAALAASAAEPSAEELAERQFRGQRTLVLVEASYFLNMNIHCNEDYQFERFEDGVNTYNDLAFPQLSDLDFLRGQSDVCDGWPVAAAPIEVKNPVSSTVPTLILQGAYDTRTPVFMGRRAARELANSDLVLVPQQGHEVWTSATNCAGQIATAFVLDPAAELDLSCLDARQPQWASPDDASSGSVQRGEGALEGIPLSPADIAVDEGGPAFVTGEMDYAYWYVTEYVKQPVVALLDVSRPIQGNFREFVPRSGQILGRLTSPFAPSPAAYRLNLPVTPEGELVDLDNDGEADTGVQVFAVVVSNNLVGDSYLEQMEQLFFYNSYESDPETGALLAGTLLVYAPDGAQGFPGSAGEDGQWFTADDPGAGLPAGYTVVTLDRDGSASFARPRQAVMNTLESSRWASPDFSDQGILESYNSLLDLLAQRYSFTELRGLDWEQIRQEYLPRVQEADAAGDMGAYGAALEALALSIRDAHVGAGLPARYWQQGAALRTAAELNGSLGAAVADLSDGRFVVTALDSAGPSAQAGWQFGTEIVSVDGTPMDERVAELPVTISAGNPEVIRQAQLQWALSFPLSTTTTVEYRLPGASDVLSASLTTTDSRVLPVDPAPTDEVGFRMLDDGYGYIHWNDFLSAMDYKLATWQRFLRAAKQAPGIIIDMRNNHGGSNELYQTMASFLFSADKPAAIHWLDWYEYDEQTGDLALDYRGDYLLSSPVQGLTYDGPVAVLVNENTVSAGEYFPQFLQRQGRAMVVGEHGTKGGGGNVERVVMPGGILFAYTKGRTTFAGADELNLEGKGVTLDLRVPITEENEQAKLDGRDPVVEAALQALAEEAARLKAARFTTNTWQWSELVDAQTQQVAIEDPASYTVAFAEDGTVTVQADCNRASGTYTRDEDGTLAITLGPVTAAACNEGSRSEAFLAYLQAAIGYELDGNNLSILTNPESGALGMALEPAN